MIIQYILSVSFMNCEPLHIWFSWYFGGGSEIMARLLKFKLHSYFEINILRHSVHRVFHQKVLTNLCRKHGYLCSFPLFFTSSYFHKWKNLVEMHLKSWFVANTKNVNSYVNINFMCIIFIRISLKFKNIGNESLRNIWLSE